MTIFDHVAQSRPVEFVLDGLGIADMLALSLCSRAWLDSVDVRTLWRAACQAFPAMGFLPEHFETSARVMTLSVVSNLAGVALLEGTVLKPGPLWMPKLGSALQHVRRRARAHLAETGGSVRMFLAKLKFPDWLPHAFASSERSPGPCISAPVVCRFPVRRGGDRVLRIYFAVIRGKLVASIRDDDLPAEHIEDVGEGLPVRRWAWAGDVVLIMDVASASGEVLLCKEGLPVRVNGPWAQGPPDIFNFMGARPAAMQALTGNAGSHIVLSLRDRPASTAAPRIANALNLDTTNGRRSSSII